MCPIHASLDFNISSTPQGTKTKKEILFRSRKSKTSIEPSEAYNSSA